MEIKYTVEILTKDIQDIEKLVRNLNNYPTPPRIELDLALAKLRNAYDLLLMIAEDTVQEDKIVEKEPEAKVIEFTPKPPAPPANIETPNHQIAPDTETIVETENTAPPVPENQEIQEAPKAPKVTEVPQAPEAQEIPKPPDTSAKEGTILADKFRQNASLNERIAGHEQNDASTMIGEPITSIKRNIGINDRFLIIRELLNGDNESFNVFIQELDQCTNINQAFQLMESRFPNSPEHDGLQVLMNLAKRKFISHENA